MIGFSNAVFITAQYASSRTLLTRLCPPDQTGAFFGVYALSGAATTWLGPTMVKWGGEIFHTQQGGFGMIAILLAIGFTGLFFVRGDGRMAHERRAGLLSVELPFPNTVTPAGGPPERAAEPGPEAPPPSWKSSRNRPVRPRIAPPGGGLSGETGWRARRGHDQPALLEPLPLVERLAEAVRRICRGCYGRLGEA